MLARNIRSIRSLRTYSTNWEEFRIPVPWGHIAAKWWGPKDKRPILAIHGWQDNSGTFDTLIPLLPKTTSFLAIDLPGCGLSSQLPPGLFSHVMHQVIVVRRIMVYFNWQKVSLLGHSMGVMTNIAYTMMYPNEVEFLICLDGFTPFTQDTMAIAEMQKITDKFLQYDYLNNLKQEPPSYTFKEMEQKVSESLKSVAVDKSKYLLARSTKPSSAAKDKFYFTTDPRLRAIDLLRMSVDILVKSAPRFTCPILLIKVDKSPFFRRKEYARKVIDIIKKNNKNFEIHDIEGAHHIHLNNPASIEGLLNQFLKKYDVNDRSQKCLTNKI